jgi:putative sugar O-methyltransferase
VSNKLRKRELELKFKVNNFKKAFPFATQDSNLNVDSKHKAILQEANKNSNWMDDLTYKNLRNWQLQSDMDAPTSLRTVIHVGRNGLPRSFKAVYSEMFRKKQVTKLRESLEDDISIINLIGASDLLRANPVHLTPGDTPYIFKHQTSYNKRWLRYVYLAGQIRKFGLLSSGNIWVDIGSYYGGLQSIIKNCQRDLSIVLVDFHHQLLRSYIFLSDLYPDNVHNLGINQNIELIKPGTFTYIPVTEFSHIESLSPDLFTNFFSFGEMRRSDFREYVNSSVFQNSKYIYNVNRFVSAPFFEPTYDSDLTVWDYDFTQFERIYFDVFPIHHYHVINRKILNKRRFRNASSPYFEMIQRKV